MLVSRAQEEAACFWMQAEWRIIMAVQRGLRPSDSCLPSGLTAIRKPIHPTYHFTSFMVAGWKLTKT